MYSISVLLQTADAIWYTYLEGSNNLVCVSVLYLLHVVFLVYFFFLLSFLHHYIASCERVVYVCGMSSVYSVDICVVCGGELSSTAITPRHSTSAALVLCLGVHLRQKDKGLESLEKFALLDGNSELCRYLASHPCAQQLPF